jgi:hypothetical protein
VQAVTNEYRALDTPPILGVKSIKAETILAAVEIRLLGLAQI